MGWQILTWRWLANAAVGDLIVMAMGGLAVHLCRQPARRTRLIVLTLVGGLVVTALFALPVAPRWTARVLPAPAPTRIAAERDHGPAVADEPRLTIAPRTLARSEGSKHRDRLSTSPASAGGLGGIAAGRAMPSAGAAVRWFALIPGLYLAAAFGLIVWWLLGQLVLWHLARGARPADATVRDRFLEISGPAGDRVRLLVSDCIALPFTYTWARPVILLPAELCAPGDHAALRYALAHEWSHVERGDAWAWNLAGIAAAIWFYQPLFWWLRRQLRLSQDYLADDRAASAGSPEDYAAYLVRLARAGRSGSPLPALGVGDRRSNLYRRVVLLVQDREPWERRCRTAWSVAAAVAAIVVIAVVSGFRLEAADPASTGPEAATIDQKDEPAEVPPAPAAQPREGKTYVGRVTDKDTGKPIAGASVLVRLSILGDPAIGAEKRLSETLQQTDSDGKYTFTIAPEQVATPWLYVYLDVNRPGYVKHYGGYGHGMIARNEKVGSRPWFEDLKLRPGKTIEARLVNPEGAPVAGVQINAFCRDSEARKKDPNEFGAFTWGATDADGRFRLDLFPAGPAVVWICPRDHALSTHVLKNNRRGDLGTIALETGNTIQGRALDAQGKPVAGAYVRADRDRAKELEEETELHGVADYTVRTVVTGADGRFTIRALPAGSYRVALVDEGWDPASRRDVENMPRRPLPGVFTPHKLAIKDGETPEPVMIRGVPHVVVEARIFDSKSKKTKGHSIDLVGKIDGEFWSVDIPPDADGVYTSRAPHGLEDTQLRLSTNEHTVLRHRLSKDAPLSRADFLHLGTLDHDIKGIEIIRYVAPIAVVKVATTDGSRPVDVVVSADYSAKREDDGGRYILKGGVRSDCSFEQQEDGRFRSEGLYPDEKLTVTARAKGYAAKTSPEFAMPEGATREIELVLEKSQ